MSLFGVSNYHNVNLGIKACDYFITQTRRGSLKSSSQVNLTVE